VPPETRKHKDCSRDHSYREDLCDEGEIQFGVQALLSPCILTRTP
jgi:hypothetical protein